MEPKRPDVNAPGIVRRACFISSAVSIRRDVHFPLRTVPRSLTVGLTSD